MFHRKESVSSSIAKGGYRVNSSIREMLFCTHNVIPFTKLNIVMCRNMLIYMEALQKKLIELFNYSLLPGGIMILGSAEAISHNNEGFES
jgi:two-component system CheB/CheR fusion protein